VVGGVVVAEGEAVETGMMMEDGGRGEGLEDSDGCVCGWWGMAAGLVEGVVGNGGVVW
jgi:hypothetical protein